MARATELGLVAVTIEGGLLAPEQVQKIAAAERTAKLAASYDCPKGLDVGDEIARYFRIGQALWTEYARIDEPSITQTAKFAHDLLAQCFGFDDLSGPSEHHDGNRRYRIAWEAEQGRAPVVVAAPIAGKEAFNVALLEFGDGQGGARLKRSPVSLLQDWLNGTEHALWGLVFAGDRMRLMRDNASLTRPAWIEADLGAMFRDEMFADFTVWWLLTHASRFGAAGAAVSDCALEEWRSEGMKQGTAARDKLRDGVEAALFELGQGAVEANPALREKLADHGALASFFEELLRTVYRLIFLAVAEDRDLLHARSATNAARALYTESYSFTFWRQRSRRRVARDAHQDAWEAMKITLACLEHGEEMLGLPALGGLFARGETPRLNEAAISNRRFLEAVFNLGYLRKDGAIHRINWRDLKTEELGSVYESLLEIRPQLSVSGAFSLDSGAKGNDRKTSGSYYTPDSLVETLLDSALDPVLDKAEAEGGIEAILDLKVIDPASGSGHFLLGAARRMADRVARLRNEDAGKAETQAALRDVVSRCIHGVDRNPMAVELAKVALWIESVSPGQPLGFLDANIRCGDALLGVFDLDALEEGIPDEAYKPLTGDDKDAAKYYLKLNRDAKKGQGSFDWSSGSGAMPPRKLAANLGTIRKMPEDTVGQVEKKKAAYEAWRHDPARWSTRVACDLYVAAFLLPKMEKPLNDQHGMVPTTADVWKRLGGGNIYGPLQGAALEVAGAARLLHWPLAFPDVMIERGGFDVVLGNPPWERIKLQEQEFFAGTEIADAPNAAARTKMICEWAAAEQGSPQRRWIDAFETAKRLAEASGVYFTSPKDEDPTKLPRGTKIAPTRRYPWTGRGDVNTYALFAEHFLNLTREGGRAGVIVPTGVATDATTAPFFGHLVSGQRLAGLTDFENSAPLFSGVHRSFKFCLLTIGSGVAAAHFAFFLTDPAQLEDERRRFTLSPADIARINPNTKTAPVFRSRHDAEFTASIYGRVPVLIEEGKEGGNPWGLSFMAMFHMSNDSRLFRTAAQLAEAGFTREGSDWLRAGSDPTSGAHPRQRALGLAGGQDALHLDLSSGSSASAVAPQRYVPLYEAKMFDQFNHRYSDYASRGDDRGNRVLPELTVLQLSDPNHEVVPFYWVPSCEASSRKPQEQYLMGYGEATTATTTRTMVMTAFPFSGIGHKTILIFCTEEARRRAAFLANANSIVLDYICRTKVSYLTLAQFIAKQLPILPPSAYSETDLAFVVPRVLELSFTSHSMAPFARDLGYEGPPFAWDEDRRAQLRAELDAWYALAYGLNRDELRYVLDPKDVMGADYPSETFRVLQNNEKRAFGEYRTRRLVLAAYDELMAQGLRPRVEGYR